MLQSVNEFLDILTNRTQLKGDEPIKVPPDPLDEEPFKEFNDSPTKPQELYGKCTLQIMIHNHGEYLKWCQYHPDRKWEFIVTYPAIMRAQYDFHTVEDVGVITLKIIQLLQIGFDVRATDWKLSEYKSQLNQPL